MQAAKLAEKETKAAKLAAKKEAAAAAAAAQAAKKNNPGRVRAWTRRLWLKKRG